MKHTLFAMLGALLLLVRPALAEDDYTLGPDSQPKPGVPQGTVTRAAWTSKIYPGTQRDYWVYVPKQYDGAKPACVMIFQDGGGFQDRNGQLRVPVVFDNLIHQGEMPVTIAIMINPGIVPPTSQVAQPRYNRSFEYDTPDDRYARFLLEEILPEVEKKVRLTTDPNGRALCGLSSGGIAAFAAAWERPDAFRRVLSFIGSFTNLRGAHVYPSLIRKTEPKPLRVFLQDGSNDQDIYSGSWFIGNNDMAAALRYAGYDMKYVVGDGGHNGKHAGAILPDALRWLWRDYPKPITTAEKTPQPVTEIVAPGSEWTLVPGDYQAADTLIADEPGNLYFVDTKKNALCRLDPQGAITTVREKCDGIRALAFSPDGRIVATQPTQKRIVAFAPDGKEQTLVKNVLADGLIISSRGMLFFSEMETGRVSQRNLRGEIQTVETGLPGDSSLALSADQSQLLVAHSAGRLIHSIQIQQEGTLAFMQPYFDLHIPYGSVFSGARGMTTDTQGRLYVASAAGIQECDQPGRVNGILLNPERTPTTQVVFGGADRSVLYVAAGGKIYRRQTKAKGALPFREPVRPPNPRL